MLVYGTETLLGVTEAKQLFESFNELNIQKLAFVLADAEGEMNVPYPNMLQLKWKIAGNDLQSNIIWQPNSEYIRPALTMSSGEASPANNPQC